MDSGRHRTEGRLRDVGASDGSVRDLGAVDRVRPDLRPRYRAVLQLLGADHVCRKPGGIGAAAEGDEERKEWEELAPHPPNSIVPRISQPPAPGASKAWRLTVVTPLPFANTNWPSMRSLSANPMSFSPLVAGSTSPVAVTAPDLSA